MTFGTNIYNENMEAIAESYLSADNNISVFKAELLGILCSIIIMPFNS
jgi:hypothetical protein